MLADLPLPCLVQGACPWGPAAPEVWTGSRPCHQRQKRPCPSAAAWRPRTPRRTPASSAPHRTSSLWTPSMTAPSPKRSGPRTRKTAATRTWWEPRAWAPLGAPRGTEAVLRPGLPGESRGGREGACASGAGGASWEPGALSEVAYPDRGLVILGVQPLLHPRRFVNNTWSWLVCFHAFYKWPHMLSVPLHSTSRVSALSMRMDVLLVRLFIHFLINRHLGGSGFSPLASMSKLYLCLHLYGVS